MKRLLFVVAMTISLAAMGQKVSNKLSPYSQVFIERNKAGNVSLKSGLRSLATGVAGTSAIIHLQEAGNETGLAELGVEVNSRIGNFITAIVPVQKLEEVAALPSVKRVEVSRPVSKRISKARKASFVDQVHQGIDLPKGYSGKGVVVGVVDAGFHYGHVNFYDKQRQTLRVKRVWNQSKTGKTPAGYTYGTEYTTADAILKAENDAVEGSHGSHVAGIAAGADTINGFYGVAPDAELVLVSMGEEESSILDGIKYVFDYAKSVGKPAVVNLSLGSHIGPHDGTSTFDQACDALVGEGRLIVGAAGNEGNSGIHIRKTFVADTLKTFFKFVDDSAKTAIADLWGEPNRDFKVALGIYSMKDKKMVYSTRFVRALGSSMVEKLNGNGYRGELSIVPDISSVTNKANVFIAAKMDSLSEDYRLCLLSTATDGTIDAWAHDAMVNFTSNFISGFTNPDFDYSVGEIGGTANSIISVGAYITNLSWKTLSNQNLNLGSYYTISDIAPFSSQGPTVDGRVKPDIAAPGMFIGSSYNNLPADVSSGKEFLVKKVSFGGKDHYYGMMLGTSMASPFVTGVMATWLEANPKLTAEQAKEILKKTATADNYTGSIVRQGDFQWGYGKVNAWAGLLEVVKASSISDVHTHVSQGAFEVEKNSNVLNVRYNTNVTNAILTLYSLDGKMISTTHVGNTEAGAISKVFLSALGKGTYVLQLSGDNVRRQSIKVLN